MSYSEILTPVQGWTAWGGGSDHNFTLEPISRPYHYDGVLVAGDGKYNWWQWSWFGYDTFFFSSPVLSGIIEKIIVHKTLGANGTLITRKSVVRTHNVEYEFDEGTGSTEHEWLVNPFTGVAWTVAELTYIGAGSFEAGVALSYSDLGHCWVDKCWVEVVYSGNLSGDIILEQALSIAGVRQSIFSIAPTWTDITSYLMALDTKRGRLHELAHVVAGEAVFTLNNASGNFWRYNSAGAFYPDVKPLTLTRLRYRYLGVVYPLWYGVSESYNPGWAVVGEAGNTPIMELGCVDFFKTFNRYVLRDANPALTADTFAGYDYAIVDSVADLHEGQSIQIYSGTLAAPTKTETMTILQVVEATLTVIFTSTLANDYPTGSHLKKFPAVLSGTRINDCLLEMGFPLAMSVVDAGQCMVIAHTPPAGGTNIMEHIYAVTESEDGNVFIRGDGYFIFQDAIARTKAPYNTSQGTFRDTGADSLYVHPELKDDDTFIYNAADIAGTGITEQIVQDNALQPIQGARILQRTSSLLANTGDAFNQAFIIVVRYGDSILRCDNLLVVPQASAADLYPKAMGWDISTRLTFILNSSINPAMMGSSLPGDYHIEGINHHWSMIDGEPNLWKTKWQLWNVNQYRITPAVHDGFLLNQDYTSYASGHNAAASSQPPYNDDGDVRVGQAIAYAGAIFSSADIFRGMMKFDTSQIGAGDTVLEAYLVVRILSNADARAWSLTVTTPQTVDAPLVDTDYHVLLGSLGDWGNVPMLGLMTGWVAIPLNALGISAINKGVGATTIFALRSSRDIAVDNPGVNSQEWASLSGFGTAYPPRLIVRLQ